MKNKTIAVFEGMKNEDEVHSFHVTKSAGDNGRRKPKNNPFLVESNFRLFVRKHMTGHDAKRLGRFRLCMPVPRYEEHVCIEHRFYKARTTTA